MSPAEEETPGEHLEADVRDVVVVVVHAVDLERDGVEVEGLGVLDLLARGVDLDLAVEPGLGDAPVEVWLVDELVLVGAGGVGLEARVGADGDADGGRHGDADVEVLLKVGMGAVREEGQSPWELSVGADQSHPRRRTKIVTSFVYFRDGGTSGDGPSGARGQPWGYLRSGRTAK